ncbi:hypothetical protein HK102_000800 [Quaeritorhiza haematococci]|nr:hypothetical protein HK102_000800 [Quaeritorhiza haematococci]
MLLSFSMQKLAVTLQSIIMPTHQFQHFEPGTLVMRRFNEAQNHQGLGRKLLFRFRGPYVVLERVGRNFAVLARDYQNARPAEKEKHVEIVDGDQLALYLRSLEVTAERLCIPYEEAYAASIPVLVGADTTLEVSTVPLQQLEVPTEGQPEDNVSHTLSGEEDDNDDARIVVSLVVTPADAKGA